MITATLLFPLVAALLVATLGRREPRLTAATIVLLLAIPLLSLLPKVAVLPPAPSAGGATMPSVMTALWLAGCLVVGVRLLLAHRTLLNWRRTSSLLETLPLGGGRHAELRQLDHLDSPVASGVIRPVIYVPAAWGAWDDATRHIVIAHESAHLDRRDPLWRTLGEVACMLHWFNPLVWWLARRQRLEAEYACDSRVVRSGVPAKNYAHVLCNLASMRKLPTSAAAMAEPSLLEHRVKHLFRPPGSVSPWITAVLLVGISTAALALSVLRRSDSPVNIPVEEVRLRLTANPFPGN